MKKLFSLFFIFIFVLMSCYVAPCSVFAGDVSSPLDDLYQDPTFDEKIYTDDTTLKPYGLYFVTMAETYLDDVTIQPIIYVYQPKNFDDNKEFYATSIRLWDDNFQPVVDSQNVYLGTFKDFDLHFISQENNFYKYSVDGFSYENYSTRVYEIVQVEREFNLAYGDESPFGGQSILTVPFSISKIFTFSRGGFSVQDLETIKVENKFCGFCRYSSGLDWSWLVYRHESIDSHFVAFSTDKQIDELLEAQISYRTQNIDLIKYYASFYGNDYVTSYDKSSVITSILKRTSEDSPEVSGNNNLFSTHYEYSRIQSVEEFFRKEDIENIYPFGALNFVARSYINSSEKEEIEKCTWVLRFLETEYSNTSIMGGDLLTGMYPIGYTESSTQACDVSILRLKFITDGVFYDLGVVDNKQTESFRPSNTESFSVELDDSFAFILKVLALIIILLVIGKLWPVLKVIFKIITYPFRLLIKAFKRKKGR